MDFYTFVDSDQLVHNYPPHHNVIQIPDANCLSVGLSRMNPTNPKSSQVCAWEKALYFFTQANTSYEYVWFIEYDVFVPNLELLKSINQEFGAVDLLSRKMHYVRNSIFEPWPDAALSPTHLLPQPWGRAMVCISRMSQELLQAVATFMSQHGPEEMDYASIEFIFHTIALRDKMSIETPKPFTNVTFKHRRRLLFYYEESEWQPQEIESKHFYHPVKKFSDQQKLLDTFQQISPVQKTLWKSRKNIEFFCHIYFMLPCLSQT
jgi:hypothetical protein